MPLTPEILAVIQAAKNLEAAEKTMAGLKEQKQSHQDAISSINASIVSQAAVISTARAELKTAAGNI